MVGNREMPGFLCMLAGQGHGSVQSGNEKRSRKSSLCGRGRILKPLNGHIIEFGKVVRAGDGAGGRVLTEHALVLSAALGGQGWLSQPLLLRVRSCTSQPQSLLSVRGHWPQSQDVSTWLLANLPSFTASSLCLLLVYLFTVPSSHFPTG